MWALKNLGLRQATCNPLQFYYEGLDYSRHRKKTLTKLKRECTSKNIFLDAARKKNEMQVHKTKLCQNRIGNET